MKNGGSRGRVIWHELITSDPAAAVEFYTRTIGWTVDSSGDEGLATRLQANDRTIGTIVPLADARAERTPHWLTYVACTDIEATCRHAESLGGVVLAPPRFIPTAGCRAVLQDPQGAILGIVAREGETEGRARMTAPGEFSWHELATTDCRAALSFYRTLFGWEQTGQFDLGAGGMYYLCGQRGVCFGGVCSVRGDSAVPTWLPYIHVADIRIAADRTAAFGGAISVPVYEVPGGEWAVVGTDPQGARFAAHQVNQR